MARRTSQLAKLTRPRLARAVPRERLFALLDRARGEGQGICVVGPPGAGKTTLVASYLDVRSIKGIWYQVDPGDADVATFFYYLGLAAVPFSRRRQRPLPALTPEYLRDVPGFSRRFFRELFARLPEGGTLVLDNYQEVDPENLFHQLVSAAVDEVREGQSLIAVSRRDPPTHYARLIANESVSVIDSEDLKLTLDEARAIAARKGCCDQELVSLIHARTAGWAAGLTLMLERTRDSEALLRFASDGHQRIFDYFAEQLFERVSEDVRDVLMNTAWLPSVNEVQAEALSGNSSAQYILDDLYRRHLFVHRRPGEPPAYQYHSLFRHFLQATAQRTLDAKSLRAIKVKSARLVEYPADAEVAIGLLCEAEEWDEAVGMIVAHAPGLLAHGRWRTLQEFAGRLPAAEVKRALWLRYWVGRSKLASAPQETRDEMLDVMQEFEATPNVLGQILCVCEIIESHWIDWIELAQLDRWIDQALVLLDSDPEFPDAETELQVVRTLMLALLLRQPHNPALVRTRERLMALMKCDLTDDSKLFAGNVLIAQALVSHDLKLAARTVHQLGSLAERTSVSIVARLIWFPRLACYYAYSGEHGLARQALERTEKLMLDEGLQSGLAALCYLGGYVSVVGGELARADRFATLLDRSTQSHWSFHRGNVYHIRCMIALARGEVTEAIEQGRRASDIARDVGMAWSKVWFPLPTIYALLEAGNHAEATALIREMRVFITGSYLEVFETELLLAEAYLALKMQAEDFHHRLAKALTRARENDYIFPCRMAFRQHRILFAEAFRAAIATDYLRRTVRRFDLRPDEDADEDWPWPIKVYTLGRFEIVIDEEPLNFNRKTPRKPIALLKALVALGGRAVSEQSLLDAIWPDEEGDAAHIDCKAALQRLRKLLGSADAITVADGTISLDRQQVWVDAFAFERMVDTGADYIRISALYLGQLMPEEREAPWVFACRDRLRGKFVRHVADTARQLEMASQLDAAARLYQRGIDADELAEELYQGLMRCHIACGRHADAMAVYRRLRQ
ncbi:MAG: hypothetical protein KIS79_05580, partial [Burkholderiales bacterium]|nr:hypothetical protein [Burkholderiales bacterium]